MQVFLYDLREAWILNYRADLKSNQKELVIPITFLPLLQECCQPVCLCISQSSQQSRKNDSFSPLITCIAPSSNVRPSQRVKLPGPHQLDFIVLPESRMWCLQQYHCWRLTMSKGKSISCLLRSIGFHLAKTPKYLTHIWLWNFIW